MATPPKGSSRHELMAEGLGHRAAAPAPPGDDFRANPVAAQHRNVSLHTRCS